MDPCHVHDYIYYGSLSVPCRFKETTSVCVMCEIEYLSSDSGGIYSDSLNHSCKEKVDLYG